MKGKGVTKMKDGMYESAAEAIEAIRALDAERKARAKAKHDAFYARFATEQEAMDYMEYVQSKREGW